MKTNTTKLTKEIIAFAHIFILLLLFQAGFWAFVGSVNSADVQGYTTVAMVSLAVGAGFVIFSIKHIGDTVSTFIFAVLLMFGATLQATLDNISRYALFIIISVFFMLAAFVAVDLFVKKEFIEKYRKVTLIALAAVSVGIMGILVLFGTGEDGTKSWLMFGSFSVQLTEFLKPLFACFMTVIFASRYLSDKSKLIYGTVLMCALGLFMLYIGEMGTLLVLAFVYVVMAFLFIKNRKLLCAYLLLIVVAVAVLALAIGFVNKNFAESENGLILKVHHVAERLVGRWNAYVRPEDYRDSYAYQVLDAQKAMAKGGLLGSNTNLWVYSFESDMIFPYILMRLGIIVGLLVIGAFTVFYLRTQRFIAMQKDIYKYAFDIALMSIIMMQTMIIAFGSLNFIPLTGIPMPLLSAGGTAMMINVAMFGLLIRESFQKQLSTVELMKKFRSARDSQRNNPVRKINGKRKIIRETAQMPDHTDSPEEQLVSQDSLFTETPALKAENTETAEKAESAVS